MATPSEEFIRKLVTGSDLSLREIARQAEIDHQPLSLWMRGATASLKLEIADKVCFALTGEHLVDVAGEEGAA